jgi:signal transduction histidine kinase
VSDPLWYRSLYWRIALGFVIFLAAVLALHSVLAFWLISGAGEASFERASADAELLASRVRSALERHPDLDLRAFAREQRQQGMRAFVIVMTDGRVAVSDDGLRPLGHVTRLVRKHLHREGHRGPMFDRRLGPSARPFEPPPFDGPGPPRLIGLANIVPAEPALSGVEGRTIGAVAVVPPSHLREYGPTVAMVAGSLLIVAATLAAFTIAGPVRRRLRGLAAVTRRVGAGDLNARASEDGGDEVAALARTFNRMAEDLATRARQLESADRTRRQLLADVSHELMTPLTAIRGYIETLAMTSMSLDAPTRERYVKIVGEETRRLERIVGDLLDLARLEGSAGDLDMQDVLVEALFGRVAARHEREAAAREVTLTTHIAPGAELVYGDPMRLEQALQNLAANALRHTPHGGRVDLHAESVEGEVAITVRDTGAGIPSEHVPAIFDRFYKADASRGGSEGSGLGLSIVKAIVERHRGRIDVTSDVGRGTTFRVRLPAAGTL